MADSKDAKKLLSQKVHIIKGLKVAIIPWTSQDEYSELKANMDLWKVHVKLSDWVSEKDLAQHFDRFGEVQEVIHKYDPITGEYRNFCYVLFANAETARQAASDSKQWIKGVEAIC